jgi:hypothetical protein
METACSTETLVSAEPRSKNYTLQELVDISMLDNGSIYTIDGNERDSVWAIWTRNH